MDLLSSTDLPMGFAMALAQNTDVLAYFAGLEPERKKAVIEKTHTIKSKQEMQSYVNSLLEMQ